MTASDVTPVSTLFVRCLPYATTDKELEKVFSEIGPLQQCFTVKDDKNASLSKGYGIVRFSSWKDAKRAKETINVIGGRRVQINYSKPRETLRERKKKKKNEKEEIEDEKSAPKVKAPPSFDAPNTIVAKSPFNLLALNLGPESAAELERLVRNFSGFLSVSRTEGKRSGFHIAFSSKHWAKRAKDALRRKSVGGKKLNLMSESQEKSVFAASRKNRLIVRNLPFKIDEAALASAFSKFGDVQEASIPLRPDGKMFGFGFVQFGRPEEAAVALKEMNLSKLLGRQIAVDWSVPKKLYQEKASVAAKKEEEDDAMEVEEDDDEDADEDDNEDADEDDNDDMDCEDDDDDDDDDEVAKEKDWSEHSDKGEPTAALNSSNVDAANEDDFDREAWEKRKKIESGKDVEEGRTVFFRNVDFAIDELALSEFCRTFGEVVLSRIVYDNATGHSKGCAFVQFKTKAGAEACLQSGTENEGLRLGSQTMVVNLALPRKEAKKLTMMCQRAEAKMPSDKRNLYLAREGFVRPGSEAAEGVSAADMNRRMKLIALKKQKLKNTNFFVSDTRLSIHNLPATCDEKRLKKVFLTAAVDGGVKGARMTECRIMRDEKRLSAKGVGKSRGFGFVSFDTHEAALAALRHSNNNPDLVGEKKRLIVEFSVESARALLIKKKRLEKAKLSAPRDDDAKGAKSELTTGKKDARAGDVGKYSGFKAAKGKGNPGLPKRLGAKTRRRDRKSEKRESNAKNDNKSRSMNDDKRKKNKKVKNKTKKSDDKEESRFQTLLKKYKKGDEAKFNKPKTKKWDD